MLRCALCVAALQAGNHLAAYELQICSQVPSASQAHWLAAMQNIAEALRQLVQGATDDGASEEHSRVAASLGSTLARMAALSKAGGGRHGVQ